MPSRWQNMTSRLFFFPPYFYRVIPILLLIKLELPDESVIAFIITYFDRIDKNVR